MSYKHDLHNDMFFDEIFQKKEGGYFVELGVFDGITISQTYFLEKQRKWKGIVVEPNPLLTKGLKNKRNCKVISNPVSDKEELVSFVVFNDNQATSKINDGSILPGELINLYELETKTLSSILKEEDSPKEIDVLCLDIEGMELKVLDEFFTNSDVKVNMIALEYGNVYDVIDFFYKKPYVKIKNPYIDFIKVDKKKEMMVEYHGGDFRYIDNGQIYRGSILELEPINWEYYYIHTDMLKQNPLLKKLVQPVAYHNF